jgi:hypothetical protein
MGVSANVPESSGAESRGRSARTLLALVGVVFVGSRLLVLPFPQPASDLHVCARYAYEQEAATRQGVSYYDLHAREVERQLEQLHAAGFSPALAEYRDVEYPPLALAVMRLPTLWMRERTGEGAMSEAFLQDYRFAYRVGMGVVDGLLFTLLLVAVVRLFAGEGGDGQAERLLAYVAGTSALWLLLYERLDLLLAALILLALVLLLSRLHYGWSFAVLAIAVNFKLVPLVLAPVWVIGSLPVCWQPPLRRRVLTALAVRSLLLLGLIAGFFMPFYLRDGANSLHFLHYHQARGLEIGSTYSSLLLVLHALGHPVEAYHAYGSLSLRSSLSPAMAALSPWLTTGLLLAATVLLIVRCRRLAGGDKGGASGTRLAQLRPRTFVSGTILFLMVLLSASKVFSPQYLLWLAPLAVLVPCQRAGRRLFLGAFLLTCVLSTVLFPFLYAQDLVERIDKLPEVSETYSVWTFKQPTLRLAIVQGMRTTLLVGMTAAVAYYLLRRSGGRRPVGDSGADHRLLAAKDRVSEGG